MNSVSSVIQKIVRCGPPPFDDSIENPNEDPSLSIPSSLIKEEFQLIFSEVSRLVIVHFDLFESRTKFL